MKRLFVGIPVSIEIKDKIKPFLDKLKKIDADLVFVSLENIHFTLQFLGDVEENKIPFLIKKLEDIASKYSPFNASIKGAGVFPKMGRINSIWLGAESKDLFMLTKEVCETLASIRKEKREEKPHLTVARMKSVRNKEKVMQVISQHKAEDFGAMIISSFYLYESTLTPQGPIYKILQEFVLK